MVWNFVIQLIIALVFYVVGELLRPKPDFEDAEAVPFSEARIPQVDPQRKQAVVWGTARINSPHIMDVTEYTTIPIRKKIKTGLFSSDRVTIGHRYFVGMSMGICRGPCDIQKLYYDDEILWDRATDPFTDEGDDGLFFDIDLPQYLGGRENGGGIVGRFRFYPGSTTQNRSVYLQTFQTPSPAYRWTSRLDLENVEIGESPDLSAFAMEVVRRPDPLGLGAAINEIGDDMNPISIIAELLSDSDFGFGLSLVGAEAGIDTVSFVAAATTLDTEGNGMTLKWTNSQTVQRIIESITKQTDSILRFNPATGKWEMKLVRDDFTVGSLLVLDPTNSTMESFARANWNETVNEVIVNYSNRDSVENAPPAIAQDISNFRRQGRHKSMTVNFPGCYSPELARNLASRELHGAGFALGKAEIKANRDAWQLLPGDPFVLKSTELEIEQIVMRVGSISFGDNQQSEIEITAIEDIFKLADNIFTAPSGSQFSSPGGPPVAVSTRLLVDQPYIFNLNDPLTVDPGNTHKPLIAANAPNGNSLLLRVSASDDNITYVDETEGAFATSGTLQVALGESAGGDLDLIPSLVIENVGQVGLLDETSFTQGAMDDNLEHLMLIVSNATNPVTGLQDYEPEWVNYESLSIVGSTVTLTNVRRGLFDTLPVAANLGDRVWFLTGENLPGPLTTESEYTSAQQMYVGYVNVNPEGESSLVTSTVTFRNRINAPYPAGGFGMRETGVGSFERYPGSAFPANADIEFEWVHRNRVTTPFNYQNFGSDLQNTTPGANGGAAEEDTEYVLRIYNNIADTLVWTVRASGGDDTFTTNDDTGVTYDWVLADQQSAGGPFPNCRAELSVVTTASGANSLLDVVRVFTVVIPINFARRGPDYFALVGANISGVHYPLGEGAAPFEDASAVGHTNATVDGSGLVGAGGPGPWPVVSAISLMGDNLGAGYQASVSIPDTVNFDLGSLTGDRWFQAYRFRAVQDAQVNPRLVVVHDDGVTAGSVGSGLAIASNGEPVIKESSGTAIIDLSSIQQRLDDGKWHTFVMERGDPGGNGDYAIIIDGCLVSIESSFNMFDSDHPMRIGGYSAAGADSYGWAKSQVTQFLADNNDVGLTTIAGIMADGLEWTPFQATSLTMWVSLFGRGNRVDHNGGRFQLDYAEVHVADIDDGSTNPYNSDISGSEGDFVPGLTAQGGTTLTQTWRDGPLNDGSLSHSWRHTQDGHSMRTTSSPFVGVAHAGGDHSLKTGDQEFAMFIIFNPDSLTDMYIYHSEDADFGVGGATQENENYTIFVNSDGRIHIHVETEGSNYRQQRTDDVCIVAGEWNHVLIANRAGVGYIVVVNGVSYSVDDAFATSGANTPAIDDWQNDRRPTQSIDSGQNLYSGFFGHPAGNDAPVNFTGGVDWNSNCADFGIVREGWGIIPRVDDAIIHYCSYLKPFPTLKDILLDWNPENVFQIESSSAADLRGNIITPTANGVFTTDEEVPLGGDDLSKPQRFDASASNRLEYTSDHLLSSKGTGVFDDFSLVLIGQMLADAAGNGVFWTNHEVGNSDNQRMVWNDTGNTIEFGSTGQSNIIGPVIPAGRPFGVVLTHEDDAGTDRWNWWEKGTKAVAESTTARAYTGLAIDRFKIGANAANSAHLEGNPHYIAAFARTITNAHARRINLKFAGFKGAMLHIHMGIDAGQGVNGTILPMHDRDSSISGFENWVINDEVGLQNATATGTPTRIKNAPCFGMPFATQFADGDFASLDISHNNNYPVTFGAWMRKDDAEGAAIQLGNAVDQMTLGINGAGNPYFSETVTPATDTGVATITDGDWVFLAISIRSDTERALYVNGALDSTFTTSRDLDGAGGLNIIPNMTKLYINTDDGGANSFDASYQLVFHTESNFTDDTHAIVYRETQHFSWRALAVDDGAVAQWLLDEQSGFVTDVFRDQFNDDYNAVPTSTGVTQDVAGILPHAPGVCVELDGLAGGINTNWSNYEAGTDNRAFECWLEPGYVGTVLSMGAITDAQALVISVDGSGDLSIHIRGAGNERIWTTSLDTGTSAHHLFVQLNGDSLHDFEVYINGVLESTIGTAGTDTVLATTATLALHIGEDVITGIGKADGNGKIYGVTVYDATNVPFSADRIALKNNAGRAVPTGIHV